MATDNNNSIVLKISSSFYPDHRDMLGIITEHSGRFGGLEVINAGAAYGTVYLEQTKLQDLFAKHLGQAILNAGLADLGSTLAWLLEDKDERDRNHVMPIFAEILTSMLKVSLNFDNQELFRAQANLYAEIIERDLLRSPYREIIDQFGPIYQELSECDEVDAEVAVSVLERVNEMLQGCAVLYGSLPQSAEDAVQPVENAPQEASGRLPEIYAGDNQIPPGAIQHYDGSIGIDVHDDLMRLFALDDMRPKCDSSQAQLEDTLACHPGPMSEIIRGWAVTRRGALEGAKLTDFRYAEVAARLIRYVFTDAQLEILRYRVPVDRFFDNFMNYVSQQFKSPPHQSVEQIRISCTAAAISCITREHNLIPVMRQLWSDLGLPVREADLMEKIMVAQMDVLTEAIRSELPPPHALVLH